MSESIPYIATNIAPTIAKTAATINIPALILGGGAIVGAGLGLKWLFSSNDPERMSTETKEETSTTNTETKKSWFGRGMDWTKDTGKLVGCCLQDWLSEQSPECAAFRQKAKNDHGIYSKLAGLTSWSKGLLIGGVALTVVIPLIKLAFDHYARTGSMTVVRPTINPEINPTVNPNINPTVNPDIKPEIKPEFKNEVKPEIKPQINPNFNLDYEPSYDPDYNPNLLQNYVPTINVNNVKEKPQIVIQPRGTVFVPYEEGKKYTHKAKEPYAWLFE